MIEQAITGAEQKEGELTVAVVAPTLEILGGQGVQADTLMNGLRGDGFNVISVPINPVFPIGLRWIRRIPFLRTVLNQLLYIPSLYRLKNVDVVHIFSASYWSFLLAQVPAIMVAGLFGKRTVLNYHSGEADDHLSNWGVWVHPWLRRVDEIVVPSVYLQQVFQHHGYSSRVIRNVVSLTDFRFRLRNPVRPRLLSVRNLEPIYRIKNTLKAFVLIKNTFPRATLTIAGYGSQEATLKQWVLAHKLRDVTFVGRVEPMDMPTLYDQSDIFINSSVTDNQPVSILEAFAAGLCVISTPTGDIPSMVRHHDTGLLVPHDDPGAIEQVVAALITSPEMYKSLVENARNEVEAYTWPRVHEAWKSTFTGEQA